MMRSGMSEMEMGGEQGRGTASSSNVTRVRASRSHRQTAREGAT